MLLFAPRNLVVKNDENEENRIFVSSVFRSFWMFMKNRHFRPENPPDLVAREGQNALRQPTERVHTFTVVDLQFRVK